MKNKQHKSLNRFRRKNWPYVVGNLLIFLIASGIILAVFIAQIVGLITMKTGQIDAQIQFVSDSCMSEKGTASFDEFAQEVMLGGFGISGLRLLEYAPQASDGENENGHVYLDGGCVRTIGGIGGEISPSDQILIASDWENNWYNLDENLAADIVIHMLQNAIVVNSDKVPLALKVLVSFAEDESFEQLLEDNGYAMDGSSNEAMSQAGQFAIPIWMAIPLDGTELFGENQDGRLLAFRTVLTVYEREINRIVISMAILRTLILIILIGNMVSTARMIRQQKKLLNALYTDVTSGGRNMLYLEDKSVRLIQRRKGRRYALVSVGMDGYSSFCTCYGSAEMEKLMEFLYQHFAGLCTKKEIAAATDKAVFALLLAYDKPEELEQRVLDMVQSAKQARKDQNLTFSIGIYEVTNHTDISTQYSYADVARETVSEDNAQRLQWFDDKMLEEHRWIHKVENEMERALAAHEFEVYLQPKYDTKEEKLAGAEALVRWIRPEEGLVPPNRFIPIFEKNGFILQLDDYMISEVAKLQAHWISEGKQVVPISVNVSRAHFTRSDLAEHICELVDRYQVPHKVIELELTESAFFDDKKILIDTVKKLKKAGFEISMDDFGAGYSSLNSLKELPLDVLKLDAEFFRGEDKDGRGDLIVSEAIMLAKKLDMRIVAEGIETREQVDALAAKDCDLIQGYYFAKPLPVSEFEKRAFGESS